MDQLHSLHMSNITSIVEAQGSYVEEGRDVHVGGELERASFANFILALNGIICVTGIAGNLLVAIVLLRVPSLRSNTSDFLVHISIVDFILCVLVIPTYLTPPMLKSTPNPGFWGEFWCRFYTSGFLFWIFAVTSVFSLITINLERYVAIVYPHKYKTVFTRRYKYLIIATCWILGALTKSDKLFLYEEDDVAGCHFLGWPNQGAQAVFGLYTFTVNFFAPLLVMVFAQWKVISTLNRQVKILTGRTGEYIRVFEISRYEYLVCSLQNYYQSC